MYNKRLAIGPLAQTDVERVAELLLRGLARKAGQRRAGATAEPPRGTGSADITPTPEALSNALEEAPPPTPVSR